MYNLTNRKDRYLMTTITENPTKVPFPGACSSAAMASFSQHLAAGAILRREHTEIHPPAMRSAYNCLDAMAAGLRANWDNQDANEISPETVARTRQVLWNLLQAGLTMPPAVLPTPSGAVSLEWGSGSKYAAIEVYKAGPYGYFVQRDDEEFAGETNSVGDIWTIAKPVLDTD
jgi:hypothetical protein